MNWKILMVFKDLFACFRNVGLLLLYLNKEEKTIVEVLIEGFLFGINKQ